MKNVEHYQQCEISKKEERGAKNGVEQIVENPVDINKHFNNFFVSICKFKTSKVFPLSLN